MNRSINSDGEKYNSDSEKYRLDISMTSCYLNIHNKMSYFLLYRKFFWNSPYNKKALRAGFYLRRK